MKTCLILVIAFVTWLATSCTDHNIPQPVTIATMPVSFPASDDPVVFLNLAVEEVGNEEVTEYGILVVAGTQSIAGTPLLSDHLFVFPEAFSPGHHQRAIHWDLLPKPAFSGDYSLYYRAYARKANGAVSYGATMALPVNIL